MISGISEGYMSRAQCIGMGKRQLHKNYTIEGAAATFHLTGSMLMALKNGEANAFILYQEEDETGSYCRLSAGAVLHLYIGDEWVAPQWTRAVSAGDVISSGIYSHAAELREIEYYVNLRRAIHELTPIDIGEDLDVGAYADWSAVIRTLQEAADEYLELESRTVEWHEPDDGDMPAAAVVEQLRTVIKGGDENRIEVDGRMASQELRYADTPFNVGTSMEWTAEEKMEAGRLKVTRKYSGAPGPVTVYHTSACGWKFAEGETLTLTNAQVELIVKKSSEQAPTVTLYGLLPAAWPEGRKSYNEIFHPAVIGSGVCNVGERSTIYLNAQGISLINNGEIVGVGIRYDNIYVELDNTAALIVNIEEGAGE